MNSNWANLNINSFCLGEAASVGGFVIWFYYSSIALWVVVGGCLGIPLKELVYLIPEILGIKIELELRI